MGKFTDFFKKIGQGIKKGATKIWDGAKKVIPRVVDVVKRLPDYADKAGRVLSLLPGKFGKFGRLIHQGGEFVKPLINQLPDGKAKEKIQQFTDNAINKGENAVNKFSQGLNEFNNKAQPWIKAGGDISRSVVHGTGAKWDPKLAESLKNPNVQRWLSSLKGK